MKLASQGIPLILITALTAMMGCKPKSGYEILVSRMSEAKAIRTQYVCHAKTGPDLTVDFLFSKPARFMVVSKDFVATTNELDGHFESVDSLMQYDFLEWDGRVFPGTGKIVPNVIYQAGPGTGSNPKDFAPQAPWKLISNKEGVEQYEKQVDSMSGPQIYRLQVKSDGTPVSYSIPGDRTFFIKAFEYLEEQPIEKFKFSAKEGYVSIRIAGDRFNLVYDRPFDVSVFKASPDVANLKADQPTLYAILDPAEATSKNVMPWLAKAGSGFQKTTVTRGNATTGYYDPDGKAIDKLTSTTPTFVLVAPDKKILGIWMGFDVDSVATFEKDIKAAMEEKE